MLWPFRVETTCDDLDYSTFSRGYVNDNPYSWAYPWT